MILIFFQCLRVFTLVTKETKLLDTTLKRSFFLKTVNIIKGQKIVIDAIVVLHVFLVFSKKRKQMQNKQLITLFKILKMHNFIA